MTALKAVAQFETTLASGISAIATSAKLSSNITGDQDNAILPSGDYGFVIDESNSYREYLIATVSGTDLAIVKRGLSFIDGDTVKVGNKFAHRKGSSIKIVSYPVITRMLGQLNGDLALDGIPKLPSSRTINNSRHVTDKEYVDNILASGIASLAVSDNGGITININSGYYSLNGTITYYAGAAAQALTDDATNYVELVDGALSINTTAFSNDGMPLAKVVTSSGDITSLTDARAILGWLDIKASSGIGRDTNGIFVDLATNPGLEFSSGKLRVKAGTGLTLGAGGVAVDVGTTDGKIVQITTGDKLPGVDGSQLTNLPASTVQQIIPITTAVTDYVTKFISDSTNGVIYAIILNAALNTFFIARYSQDPITKQFIQTHTTTFNSGASTDTGWSATVVGNYIYLSYYQSSNKCHRFDKADLANPQAMTISGGSISTNGMSFGDGTNLYTLKTKTANNVFNKYTISGTTMTYDSTLTYNASGSNASCSFCDGTNVYIHDTTGTTLGNLRKYALAGGDAIATITKLFPALYTTPYFSFFQYSTTVLGIAMSHVNISLQALLSFISKT